MARINILEAKVGHAREKPAANRFQYRVFYIDYPIVEAKIEHPTLLSFDRFNIFSIFARDHGKRDGSSLYQWFTQQCADRGIQIAASDSVRLISHPRLFGYAFNPISFWILQDSASKVRAVLCEVNNTFRDNHNYLLAHEDFHEIVSKDVFRAEKKLYVSPFNKVQGHYLFSFTILPNEFKVSINYFVGEERILATFMGGSLQPLTSGRILSAIVRYPFMTFLVVCRIYWQALRLKVKGVPPTIDSMPPPLHGGTTHGSSASK